MATTQRTDAHRPSEIVPAHYDQLLSYSLPSSQDGGLVPSCGVDCVREKTRVQLREDQSSETIVGVHAVESCCVTAATDRARVDGRQVFGSTGKCGVCGANFLHGDLWRHAPTGALVHLGHDCADKYGLLADRSSWALRLGRLRAAVASTLIRQRRQAARDEFLDDHPGLREALELADAESADKARRTIADIKARFMTRPSLSDKQVAFVLRLAEEIHNPKTSALEEVKVAAPLGKVTFSGEVVSVRDSKGLYGFSQRVTIKVRTSEGVWLANGTLTKSVRDWVRDTCGSSSAESCRAVLRGKVLDVRATLVVGREPHFVFMKRPVLRVQDKH